MPKYGGEKISVTGVSPKWVKSRRRRKKKKEGENNGQLCFMRHHGWRTQARLDQKTKVGENNGPLRFRHAHQMKVRATPLSMQSPVAISLSYKCSLLDIKSK